jgi:lipoate-protein ligase A
VALSDRALSIGVAVPLSSPYVRRARDLGIDVVRRASGGTGVLHEPGDLAWTIVLPRSDHRVGRDFVRAYGRLGVGVLHFLKARGKTAGWGPPLGLEPDICFLSERGQVLKVGDRVLGGAAQHLSGRALLHHGVVSRRVDRALVSRLFGLPRPEDLDRLTSLEEIGLGADPSTLARELADAIGTELGGGMTSRRTFT